MTTSSMRPSEFEFRVPLNNNSDQTVNINDLSFSWGSNKKLTKYNFTDLASGAIYYSWTGSHSYALTLSLMSGEHIPIPAGGGDLLYLLFGSFLDNTPSIDLKLDNGCSIVYQGTQ
jgi:hypothetical protein